jgi:hypothetical protein
MNLARSLDVFRVGKLTDADLAAIVRHPGSSRRIVRLALAEQDIRAHAAHLTGNPDPTEPYASLSRPGTGRGVGQDPGAPAEPGGVNLPRPS